MSSYLSRKPQGTPPETMDDGPDIFIAYSCGHYEVIKARDYDIVVPELFEEARKHLRQDTFSWLFGAKTDKAPKSLDDLWTQTEPKYVNIPIACDEKQCQTFDLKTVERRIKHHIQRLHNRTAMVAFDYINLGIRYHNIVPAARAKLAFDADCRLAHQQFGIERRHWTEDLFFQPLLKMREHLKAAATLLRTDTCPSQPLLTQVLKELNAARAYYYIPVIDQQEALLKGVEKLENTKFKPQRMEIPNPFGRVKGSGSLKLMRSPVAMPTLAFELAGWNKWKERMSGFYVGEKVGLRKRVRTRVCLE